MHIKVENISLASLELEVHPEHSANLSFNLAATCQSNFPEPNRLIQVMEFDLARNVTDPPFTFKFTFVSVFQSEGEGSPTLEEFAKVNAPAYVMPYARELVANITSRIGIIPPLMLPPINVFQLIEGPVNPDVGSSPQTPPQQPTEE
jgi:preprotein translocase subunit SecB